MNVSRFRFTLESSFEHLLRRDIFTPVELNDPAIVKRVGITWKNAFGPQTRFRNRQPRASTSCDFRHLRILVYQNSKLIACLGKPASDKLLVRAFKRYQGR